MAFGELAALIRAVAHLHPVGEIDRDLVQALGRLLAPGRSERRPVKARQPDAGPRAAQQAPVERPPDVGRAPGSGAQDATAPLTGESTRTDGGVRHAKDDDRLVAIKSLLQLITAHADLVPEQRDSAPQRPESARAESDMRGLPIPVEALFPAGRVRAILREMATVPMPSGRPDMDAAVQLIAAAQPIREMPQFLVTALPHSIHWLFEAGPSMLPFARDKQQLARTATRLLGQDRVRIADFLADPRKGTRPRGQVKWRPLHWPGRQSAVVIVSDLGIGDDQMIDARAQGIWWSFTEEAAQRGVSTVLLNPYEHQRWPPVTGAFDLSLTWDAGAGVQALRRTRRSGKDH